MEKYELKSLLEKHNVPYWEWGTNEAKTFEHLLDELNSGEAVLQERNGLLVRVVRGTSLHVYYREDASTWILKEEKQVFADGRQRIRNIDISIGEKARPGELPGEAAWRALREELGISDKLPLIPRPLVADGPVPSRSFPGLYTEHIIHIYDVFLPKRWFCPEGYIERQSDKTTFFVWREL